MASGKNGHFSEFRRLEKRMTSEMKRPALQTKSSDGTHKIQGSWYTAATRIPAMAKRAIPSVINAPIMHAMPESCQGTGAFLNMGLFSSCMAVIFFPGFSLGFRVSIAGAVPIAFLALMGG